MSTTTTRRAAFGETCIARDPDASPGSQTCPRPATVAEIEDGVIVRNYCDEHASPSHLTRRDRYALKRAIHSMPYAAGLMRPQPIQTDWAAEVTVPVLLEVLEGLKKRLTTAAATAASDRRELEQLRRERATVRAYFGVES